MIFIGTASPVLLKYDDYYDMLFEKDLNWDTVKKKITEAKISNALSSVKFEVFGMCSVF